MEDRSMMDSGGKNLSSRRLVRASSEVMPGLRYEDLPEYSSDSIEDHAEQAAKELETYFPALKEVSSELKDILTREFQDLMAGVSGESILVSGTSSDFEEELVRRTAKEIQRLIISVAVEGGKPLAKDVAGDSRFVTVLKAQLHRLLADSVLTQMFGDADKAIDVEAGSAEPSAE
jgi:hypothetical protein